MTSLTGGCLCGAVRYTITRDADAAGALKLTYCHCSMCRKATGGGYAAFVNIARSALAWTHGTPAVFRSSPIATRGFCQHCGSPLYYDADAEDVIALSVGSIDDPSHVQPHHHYGIESRLPWADCGPDLPGRETIERFEGQP